MKNLYLSLALSVLAIMPAFSQDTLKITRGKFSTELNVNPFVGELSLNNAIKQIKFRYFTSDLSALRVAFTYNTNNRHTEETNPYGSNSFTNINDKKATTVGLNVGYEKHFRGTKRLSPYIGIELGIANKSSSHTLTVNEGETKVKGAWMVPIGYDAQSYEERAFFSYGLNLLTGFDFYIAQHFYLGYELGFGFTNIKYKDIDVSRLYTSGSPTFGNIDIQRDDKDFILGPNLVNGIRLGFVF